MIYIVATINKLEPNTCSLNSNISNKEESALSEIKALTRTELEIKKADKTGTIVIMNKADYCNQLIVQCHLQTTAYEEVPNDIDKNVNKELNKLCKNHHSCLTDNECRAIQDD